MITPEEIRKKSYNLYLPYLKAWLGNEAFFPQIIRSDKRTENGFMAASQQIDQLLSQSKNKTGFGYTVGTKLVKTKNLGEQSLPDKIIFDTAEDFLQFHKKQEEFDRFVKDIALIRTSSLPLEEWLSNNPAKVIDQHGNWESLLHVCQYFIENPFPNKYMRELPIDVHTKFIEENEFILSSLLDALLGENINDAEKKFEKRYNLKFDIEAKDWIRLRFLDKNLFINGHISQLQLLPNEFNKLSLGDYRVFITENKMNLLTLPCIERGIAIFGGGFNVSNLKNASWFNEAELYYWGDLDSHGFIILSRIRGYFPHIKSMMMDEMTFIKNRELVKNGVGSSTESALNLTNEEQALFLHININNLRLEQEKIPFKYVIEFLEDNNLLFVNK